MEARAKMTMAIRRIFTTLPRVNGMRREYALRSAASILSVILFSHVLAADPVALRFADPEAKPLALDAPGVLYLVDFWAMGCKPCFVEMPELDRLAKELEPTGKFRLVSVAWGWTPKDLNDVAKRAGVTRAIYADPEGWFSRLGCHGFPCKALVRDGVVLRQITGGGAGAYEKWKKAIVPELGKRE